MRLILNAVESILVVDDNPSVRGFIEAVLAGDRYDLSLRANLQGGLDALASGPSVVIVDLSLSGESGIPIIERAAALTPRPGIIAISGSDSALDQAERAGADELLDKPFSPSRLRTAICTLLDSTQAPDS